MSYEKAILEVAPPYQFVDDIPGVLEDRQHVRAEAEEILESRRRQSHAGTEQDIPLPVDALSTAQSVLAARDEYGEQSTEYQDRLDGLELDCQRLVAEWWRKLKPEWFTPVKHTFDREQQAYISHGHSVRKLTENALTPIPGDPEEETRRVNERVEDETPLIVKRHIGAAALKGKVIRTISECTDKALNDYEADMLSGKRHSGYGGYVPEVKKLGIRDFWVDEQGNRLEEYAMLPGEYAEHSILLEALKRQGLSVDGLGKTELHAAQFIANDRLMEFVGLVDRVSSEEWCTTVFMGEEVGPDHNRDYSAFQREALQRQEVQQETARRAAVFVMDLAQDRVDPRKAPAMVEEFVKKMLLDIGKQDKEAAEGMFGQKTADGLQEVFRLERLGEFAEARAIMIEVEKNAPGGGYCGAGSCGIESFDENSAEGEKIKEGLDSKPGDTLVKDNERACPSCKKKGNLYYAYTSGKVNKLCTGCGAKESKKTVFAGRSSSA